MDKLQKWSVHLADLKSLISKWEQRRTSGVRITRRMREIRSICLFALSLENRSEQRYLIGFQQRGIPRTPVPFDRLFDNDFGEIEDCDFVLVDDPKKYGPSIVDHHRTQLVSFLGQPSTEPKDWVAFLEKKKLKVAPDDDLRLVIHVEQPGKTNLGFLWGFLQMREPKCPYSQVFVFGLKEANPVIWYCAQVYPELVLLNDLPESDIPKLLSDREQYCKPKPQR